MASKMISVSLDVYNELASRRGGGNSFDGVLRRLLRLPDAVDGRRSRIVKGFDWEALRDGDAVHYGGVIQDVSGNHYTGPGTEAYRARRSFVAWRNTREWLYYIPTYKGSLFINDFSGRLSRFKPTIEDGPLRISDKVPTGKRFRIR
jgi:hypothetical protein